MTGFTQSSWLASETVDMDSSPLWEARIFEKTILWVCRSTSVILTPTGGPLEASPSRPGSLAVIPVLSRTGISYRTTNGVSRGCSMTKHSLPSLSNTKNPSHAGASHERAAMRLSGRRRGIAARLGHTAGSARLAPATGIVELTR